MGMQLPELHFKPKLRIINDEQIMQIHMATLEILERTGVKMTHPRGVELLDGAGAKVEGDRVRIPAWMVEDAIRKAPSRVVLGNATVNGRSFWGETRPGSGPVWIALTTWTPSQMSGHALPVSIAA